MTRIPRHLLRAGACLTGGVLALGLIIVAAVGSAMLTGGLTLAAPARRLRPGRPRRAARIGRLRGVRRDLVLCGVAALAVSAPALANVSGPDDSLPQAYGPLQPGVDVSGAFTRPDDVDYLSFIVTAPHTAVHFDVTNTVGRCGSPDGAIGCAVFGTLIDGQQHQLGGEGSSAGTGEVDAGGRDVIDWVIADPGTYYLAMDSGGFLPTYRVRLAPPTPAVTGPVIVSLAARSALNGRAVRTTVQAGRALRSLTAKLSFLRHGKRVALGHTTHSNVAKGSATLKVAVNRIGQRALALDADHRLRVRLSVNALPVVGNAASAQRSLTLHR